MTPLVVGLFCVLPLVCQLQFPFHHLFSVATTNQPCELVRDLEQTQPMMIYVVLVFVDLFCLLLKYLPTRGQVLLLAVAIHCFLPLHVVLGVE